MLRYFKNEDLRAVGIALGTSEDAAQKRVTRALEKLRAFLLRHGVTLSSAALASALTGSAVQAAPAALAGTISAAAIAGAAAAAAGSTFNLLNLMSMTKLKAGLLSAAVVVGAGTPIVVQQQSVSRLRAENQELRAQSQELERLRSDIRQVAGLRVDAEELSRLREEAAELHRLRAEVARLRREKEEAAQLAAQIAQLREALARFASAPEKKPEGQKPEPEILPLVWFEDMPLHDAIHTLAHQGNLNLVFDPEVAPQLDHYDSSLRLSIRLEKLTAEQALQSILSTNNLRLVKTPGPTWKRSEDVAEWAGDVVGITRK